MVIVDARAFVVKRVILFLCYEGDSSCRRNWHGGIEAAN